MSEYTTTTDRAVQIRAAYKTKGWSSRDISVRAEYYSMGSSLHVRIKNPAVPLAVVEAIANEHESISRDQFGDILSGGNTYVHVGYSSEASAALAARVLPALQAAEVELMQADDNSLIPVAGTPFKLGFGGNHYGSRNGRSLWKDGHIQSANSIEYLATTAAIQMQGGR